MPLIRWGWAFAREAYRYARGRAPRWDLTIEQERRFDRFARELEENFARLSRVVHDFRTALAEGNVAALQAAEAFRRFGRSLRELDQ